MRSAAATGLAGAEVRARTILVAGFAVANGAFGAAVAGADRRMFEAAFAAGFFADFFAVFLVAFLATVFFAVFLTVSFTVFLVAFLAVFFAFFTTRLLFLARFFAVAATDLRAFFRAFLADRFLAVFLADFLAAFFLDVFLVGVATTNSFIVETGLPENNLAARSTAWLPQVGQTPRKPAVFVQDYRLRCRARRG
ncbi:MAG: hypothetical protein ABI192_15845 [Bradyrhizobium sp.]